MRLHPTLAVLAAAVTALTLPLPTLASETDLSIVDAYVRMVPPGTPNSAAFMTIGNRSSSDRKLLKVESPAAKRSELHTHINDQGMMRMRQVEAIEIKAAAHTELKPGGYHIMLLDLQQSLQEGDSVPLTLRFDDGSTKEIAAAVKKPQTVMKATDTPEHGAMKH
jgi:copper(I)-binding protein